VPDWPEPVQRVAGFLEASGAEARIEQFANGTPTAKDAADAVGCALTDIVKSLVFRCDDRAVLVMVPGDRRADSGKVASHLGCTEVRIARPDEVREATGFDPGAVAPFPLPHVETVLIDRSLLSRELVWIGSGSEHHLVGLEPSELVRLSRATAMDAVGGGA
jgi:prolyl-tRNA editing enzyme YbaK/EbsC (Cys-tRNA(Pro) deacylase)